MPQRGHGWDEKEEASLLAVIDECISDRLPVSSHAADRLALIQHKNHNRTWTQMYNKLTRLTEKYHALGWRAKASSVIELGSSCLSLELGFRTIVESQRNALRQNLADEGAVLARDSEDTGNAGGAEDPENFEEATSFDVPKDSGILTRRTASDVVSDSEPDSESSYSPSDGAGKGGKKSTKQAATKRKGEQQNAGLTKMRRLEPNVMPLNVTPSKSNAGNGLSVAPSSQQQLLLSTSNARMPEYIVASQSSRQSEPMQQVVSPNSALSASQVASSITGQVSPPNSKTHQETQSSENQMRQRAIPASEPTRTGTTIAEEARHDLALDSGANMDDEDALYEVQAYSISLGRRMENFIRQRNADKARFENAQRRLKEMESRLAEANEKIQQLESNQSIAETSKLELARQVQAAKQAHEADRETYKDEMKRMGEALAGKNRIRQDVEQQYRALVSPSLFVRVRDFPPLYNQDDVGRRWLDLWKKGKEGLFGLQSSEKDRDALFRGAAFYLKLMCGTEKVESKELADYLGKKDLRRALVRVAILYPIFTKGTNGIDNELQEEIPESVWQVIAKNGLKDVRTFECVRTLQALKNQHLLNAILPQKAKELCKGLQELSSGVACAQDFYIEELIRFKLDLLVGAEVHKLVFMPPNTPFDPDRMTALKNNDFPDSEADEHPEQYRVVVCLWPGIVSYPDVEFKDEFVPGQDYKDALLSSRKFFSGMPGKFSGFHTDECVFAKALVRVKKISF